MGKTINEKMTMFGGRQGDLDGGTWHGGRQELSYDKFPMILKHLHLSPSLN